MRIVVWNECYFSGGADWSLIDLINNWPDKNDYFIVYVNKSHQGLNLLKNKIRGNIEIRTFVSFIEWKSFFKNKSKIFSFYPVKIGVFLIYCIYGFITCKSLFSKKNYDLLLINNGGYPGGISNFIAAVVAKLQRVKRRVMIVRNYSHYSYKNNIYMNFMRYISQYSLNAIITVSESLKLSMMELSGIRSDMFKTIYNGIAIDDKCSKNGEACSTTKFVKGMSVGIVGSLEERKGHKILFCAWKDVLKKFPNAKLYIVGSSISGDKNKLIEFADQIRITRSLCWVEFVPNMGDIYKKLDVVVMPSQEFESFGRVAVEAMAFRKPIIASRVGGLQEIIEHKKTGILFQKNNYKELAGYLCDLLESNEKRKRIGEKGYKKYLQSFTAKTMAKKYFEILNESA